MRQTIFDFYTGLSRTEFTQIYIDVIQEWCVYVQMLFE